MNPYMPSDLGRDESFQLSLKNLKKHSRRAKTGSLNQLSKTKLTKPQFSDTITESPYAQIQSISKARSISSIKLKLPSKNTSNYLNTTSSNALLTKNKLNPSTNPSNNSESHIKSKLLFSGSQTTLSKSSAKAIEEKLNENLKKFKEKNSGKFEVYRNAFSEIIEKDENYRSLLKKIKDAYEQRLKVDEYDSSKDLIEKFKDEIRTMQEKILKGKEDKKFLVRKIEKLAKENAELSRHLDDRESRYIDLQDKLLKLSKIDLEEMPKDEES